MNELTVCIKNQDNIDRRTQTLKHIHDRTIQYALDILAETF